MKVKIKIPTSLSEIKLKNYQKYLVIEKDNPKATEFLNLKVVELFCGLKIRDVKDIRFKDYEDILLQINKTFEQATKVKFKKFLTLNGVEFGFIPDLENISMGEYIDLTTYLSDPATLHKAMAVMYRPAKRFKNDMYLIEEYESADKYSGIMSNAPLDVYLGSQVFFYNLGKELVMHTLSSLMNQEGKDSELQRILDENGDGIAQFMHLLKGDFGSLIPSLN